MIINEPHFCLDAENAEALFEVLYAVQCNAEKANNPDEFCDGHALDYFAKELDKFVKQTGYREPGYDG